MLHFLQGDVLLNMLDRLDSCVEEGYCVCDGVNNVVPCMLQLVLITPQEDPCPVAQFVLHASGTWVACNTTKGSMLVAQFVLHATWHVGC